MTQIYGISASASFSALLPSALALPFLAAITTAFPVAFPAGAAFFPGAYVGLLGLRARAAFTRLPPAASKQRTNEPDSIENRQKWMQQDQI